LATAAQQKPDLLKLVNEIGLRWLRAAVARGTAGAWAARAA
jgi:hypothetical protein